MNTLEQLRSRKNEIDTLAQRHGASHIRVFGSVARGDDTEFSDIDILIDMKKASSLLDLIGFQQDLSKMVGRRADVLTERALSPYLRERILSEAVDL